jgi:thioredoxin 1
LAAEFGIRNIPTIIFMKDGQVVDKVVGAVSKATLDEKFKALL